LQNIRVDLVKSTKTLPQQTSVLVVYKYMSPYLSFNIPTRNVLHVELTPTCYLEDQASQVRLVWEEGREYQFDQEFVKVKC